MSSIGLDLVAIPSDAARLGRLRIADALVFANGTLADMDRWRNGGTSEISSRAPIRQSWPVPSARKSVAPAWIHEAANDDLRQMKVAVQ